MPKRKTVEAIVSASAPEPAKKRKSTLAATHKRATKSSKKETVILSENQLAVETRTPSQQEIAVRAYYFAAARNFQGGCPVEDWLRAEQELTSELAQNR